MKTLEIKTHDGSIPVSKVIMGSTYIGTSFSKEKSYEFLDRYYSRGGRTIDTARVYGQVEVGGVSESEKVIGEWLADRGVREEITLITKGAHPPLDDFSHSRVTSEAIQQDIDDSLECLGVDTIDVYFLHRDDANADLQEIMQVLTQAVKDGKIKTFGASNWTVERMLAANKIAEENHLFPFTVAQIQWSLAACDAEGWGDDTLVFMTRESHESFKNAGIPVLAYAAQAKGLFSQYIEQGPEHVKEKAKRFLNDTNLKRIERTRQLVHEKGMTPAQVCVSYLVDNTLPGAAIIGCSTLAQLDDSMDALEFSLSPEEIAWLVEK